MSELVVLATLKQTARTAPPRQLSPPRRSWWHWLTGRRSASLDGC